MVKRHIFYSLLLFVLSSASIALAEQAGSIRGMVRDSDFDAPLGAAQVLIAESGEKVTTSSEGNYVFGQVQPGTYTLVFSKDGYTRQVKANVIVSPGRMTEVDASMAGEFTEMDEFVVQDVQIGGATDAALLELRVESPALLSSISSDLMSKAGASDAASALKLVSGATVQDGKYAVIRGLPDRYVNSQMNGIRLPTADADKRAVELDQFPSAVIESIQVSKTFTPDQQGDASGGAVNVVLKGIPDEAILKVSSSYSYNTQVAGSDDFLSYEGGGVNCWGKDNRDIPHSAFNPGRDDIGTFDWSDSFDRTVGVSEGSAPTDWKFSISGGGKYHIDDDIKIGGFGSFFYERDSFFSNNGVDNKYWILNQDSQGDDMHAPFRMSPQTAQGSPSPWDPDNPYDPVQSGSFYTKMFDVTKSVEEVKWGTLGVFSIETDEHSLSLVHMYTRTTQDKVTLAEDTRGKDYYFPASGKYGPYDSSDSEHPGNKNLDAAPYLRLETLEYTERTTETLQFSGKHKLMDLDFGLKDIFMLGQPELDWTIAHSTATLYQPDKRLFGSVWKPSQFIPGIKTPWWSTPDTTIPASHQQFKPAANFTLGNVQRIWKEIEEESDQKMLNLKIPFEQWTGDEGYFKVGWFEDITDRDYDQESFSNFGDIGANYEGDWSEFWSQSFPDEEHRITASGLDVDYEGHQEIKAWYYMFDVPLTSWFTAIAGARYESTKLSIENFPDLDEDGKPSATWIVPGGIVPIEVIPGAKYDEDPQGPNVDYEQEDTLPSIGFVFEPLDSITVRGSYTETVARQTFKELTPIAQSEYLGGDVFIGNPDLKMSSLKNYDLRLDFTPNEGTFFSMAWFKKDIQDPIEYVQGNAGFTYTYPVNYPEGTLEGYEFEIRQQMGRLWEDLSGLTLGGNVTLIDSEVTLSEDESDIYSDPEHELGLGGKFPEYKRDMTNAPEHLYNIYLMYNLAEWGLDGTDLSLFYTVRGDTLIAGSGQSKGNYIPSVYETEFGTLNFSLSHKIGKNWTLKFSAKNLLDPDIETVYRSKYIDDDYVKTSYKKGREFSVGLSGTF